MNWYVHIGYINKPKNKKFQRLYAVLTETDGKLIEDPDAYKAEILEIINELNKKFTRSAPINAYWQKTKSQTGKEVWLLNCEGIGYELLKVSK